MGRADDKEGEALLSEADDERDKDYSDKDTSDIDDADVESKKKYKCTEPGCDARFLRPSRLTWHLRKHNDERPYKCSIEGCTRAYTNSSHLKRHENTHKPVTTTYTCKECLLEVGSLFSLKRHRRMIHDPKRLTCADCGAKFRKKHCYNEHLSMHAGVSMYKCKVCNLDFPTLRLMKRHQLTHEKRKTYACKSPGCTEVFDKWSKLGKHVETAHQFAYKCENCDKIFKLRKQLRVHAAIHLNENIFLSCPYKNCPRFYTHEKNLDEHIETKHQGRRFHCDNCDVSVTSKASLIRHMKKLHELPLETPKKRKKPRRKRKDTGIPKNSMAIKLAGLKVPYEIEKRVLRRSTRIVLENSTESLASIGKNKQAGSSSLVSVARQDTKTILKKAPLKESTVGLDRVAQSFVSLEGKSESESASVLDPTLDDAEINLKKSSHAQKNPVTPLSVDRVPRNVPDEIADLEPTDGLEIFDKHFEESSGVPEQTEEEILCSASNLLRSGKLIVLESNEKKFPDMSEGKSDEILVDQLMGNDEEMVLENLIEKSVNLSEETDDEMTLVTADLTSPGRLEMLEKNVDESLSCVPEQMEEEMSLLVVDRLSNCAEIVPEDILEKFYDRLEETNAEMLRDD